MRPAGHLRPTNPFCGLHSDDKKKQKKKRLHVIIFFTVKKNKKMNDKYVGSFLCVLQKPHASLEIIIQHHVLQRNN